MITCSKQNFIGQYPISYPKVAEITVNNRDWAIAFLRFFYITFQVASSYFVFMIVLLRLLILHKPMMVFSLKSRMIKTCTAIIWGFSIFLNFLPVLSSVGYHEDTKSKNMTDWKKDGLELNYETKDGLMVGYIVVADLGLAIPLFLTVFAYISMIFILRNKKKGEETRKEARHNENFRKLINGLVIWLMVCNAPYIYWAHWSLFLYLRCGNFILNINGVIN